MKQLCTLAFLFSFAGNSVVACGPDTDCDVGSRTYRIALPTQTTETSGAIVFAHGFGGSAQGTMNNAGLRTLADDLGVALVALQVATPDWELPFSPRAYDSNGSEEFAYVDSVLADLAAQHDLDTGNVLMTGFSAGGMMTWNLACYRSSSFIGFVPLSGTFWLEVPDDCDSNVAPVYHFHGANDTVVPFEGRQIRNTHQGSVTQTIEMYRDLGGFNASQTIEIGAASCELSANDRGQELGFCTFDGGHSFRRDFIQAAWERLQVE